MVLLARLGFLTCVGASSAISVASAQQQQALEATLSPSGALTLGLNGEPWLASGPTAMRQKARWYFSDCPATEVRESGTKCQPLVAGARSTESGTDAVGQYSQSSITWNGQGDPTATMKVGLRKYASMPDVVGLVQTFPEGLEPRNRDGLRNEVVSAFPTFGTSLRDLGVVFYEGVQLQNTRYFPWFAGTAVHSSDPGPPVKRGKSAGAPDPSQRLDSNGEGGMPLLLVDTTGSGLVFSPLVSETVY